MVLLPFMGSFASLYQIFRRVFPIERGLYEDKVANIWCVLSVVVKLRSLFTVNQLMGCRYLTFNSSIFFTLCAVLPSGIHLMIHPNPKGLLYALFNSALGFFIFSFQVHEKSILLAALPASLLMFDEPTIILWFENVATYSLFPLLMRDQLGMQYFLVVGLWNLFSFSSWRKAPFFIYLFQAIMLISNTAALRIPPPARYPDIYVVLNVTISASQFVLIFFYMNWKQFTAKVSKSKKKVE